jgi:hypothetical protein
MKGQKTGRNDPCPCRSGLKFKKCHGRSITDLSLKSETVGEKLFVRLPTRIQQEILKREVKEKRWKTQYGQVRPTISTDFQGYKMVAVGNQLHYSKKWKTFHDFLFDYIKNCLGSEWGNSELRKDYAERHPILQWYKALCDFQRKNIKQEGEIYSAYCTGPVGAYLSLS